MNFFSRSKIYYTELPHGLIEPGDLLTINSCGHKSTAIIMSLQYINEYEKNWKWWSWGHQVRKCILRIYWIDNVSRITKDNFFFPYDKDAKHDHLNCSISNILTYLKPENNFWTITKCNKNKKLTDTQK